MLRVPDRRLRGQSSLMSWMTLVNPNKDTVKFRVDIFIRSVSRMGDPSWGYLEVVEGS